MRYLVLLFVAVGMMMAGCQNKELLQCQQDNRQLQEEKASIEKGLKLLMQTFQDSQKQSISLEAQVNNLEAEKSELQEKREQERVAMGKALSALKGEAVELGKERADINKKLENMGDMTMQLAAENKELQSQIAELEGKLKEQEAEEASN